MYTALTEFIKKTKINIESDTHIIVKLLNGKYYDLKSGKMDKRFVKIQNYSYRAAKSINSSLYSCSENENENKYLVLFSGKTKYVFLAVYYSQTNIAGLHRLMINAKNIDIKNNEKREPILIDTLWFNNKKEMVYQCGKNFTLIEHKKDLPKNFLTGNCPEYLYDKNKNIENMMMLLFKQKSPIFYMDTRRGNSYITTPWILREFLFSKESVKRNTKKQKLIDELGRDLKENCFNEKDVINEINKQYFSRIPDIIFVIEKTNIGCVIRGFLLDKANEYKYPAEERYRIFITKKEVIYSRKNNMHDFVITTKLPQYNHSYTVEFEHNILEGTKLEYIKDYLNIFEGEMLGNFFLAVLNYTIIEQALKAGLKDYIVSAFILSENAPKNDFVHVKDILIDELYIKEYNSSFNKLIGLTTKQYKSILQRFPITNYADYNLHFYIRYGNPIKHIKKFIQGLTINVMSLDEKTFTNILNFYGFISDKTKHQISNTSHIFDVIEQVLNALCQNTENFKIDRLTNELNVVISYYDDDPTVGLYLYRDYLLMRINGMLDGFINGNEFPIFPKENIYQIHDRIMETYDKGKMEVDRNKFMNNCKKCERFKYKDANYMVIVPNSPEEIQYEGEKLHHCVFSYINLIAEGKTNIMFIRKSNEPDIPFFTVEISDDGHIEQIHGLQNRNVDTEPGLESFIDEWIQKLELSVTNYNIIR